VKIWPNIKKMLEPRESLNPAICGNLGASSYLKW